MLVRTFVSRHKFFKQGMAYESSFKLSRGNRGSLVLVSMGRIRVLKLFLEIFSRANFMFFSSISIDHRFSRIPTIRIDHQAIVLGKRTRCSKPPVRSLSTTEQRIYTACSGTDIETSDMPLWVIGFRRQIFGCSVKKRLDP